MSDAVYNTELLRLAADAAGAGRLADPDASATLHNPACGDRITMDLGLKDGRITALAHHTHACILTQASAAILGTAAIGASRAELESLADGVRAFLKGGTAPAHPFGAYGVFAAACVHPGRHVCVLLPLQAALEALDVSELAEPRA
jgi:nitrogen fixation NifU-like protein